MVFLLLLMCAGAILAGLVLSAMYLIVLKDVVLVTVLMAKSVNATKATIPLT